MFFSAKPKAIEPSITSRRLPGRLVVAIFALVVTLGAAAVIQLELTIMPLTLMVILCLWTPFLYSRPVPYAMLAIFLGVSLVTNHLVTPALRSPWLSYVIGGGLTILLIELIYAMLAQRRSLESSLSDALTRMQLVFENVSDALFVEDMDGQILAVNQRAGEMFLCPHEELVGKYASELVPPENAGDLLQNQASEGPIESVNQRLNGEKFPVEVYASRFHHDQRELMLVVVRDISRRKQIEHLLVLQNRFVLEISSASSLESAALRLLTTARSLPGVDAAGLYLMDASQQHLELLQCQGFGPEDSACLAAVSADSALGYTVRQGLPRFFTSQEAPPEPLKSMHTADRIKAVGIIPIFYQRSIMAAFLVGSFTEVKFPPDTVEAIEPIVYAAGNVLSRLIAESRLRASEKRFRTTFESAILGMFQITPDSRLQYANAALASILGCQDVETLYEMVGEDISQVFWHTADHLELLERLAKKEQNIRETCKLRRQDGEPIIAHIGIWSVLDASGQMQYLEGYVEDVTERQRLVKQLEVLHTIDKALLAVESLDDNLREILAHIHALVPYERALLWLEAETHLGQVKQAAYAWQEDDLEEFRAAPDLPKAALEWIASTSPCKIQDLEIAPSHVQGWLDDGLEACQAIRLHTANRNYGYLLLLARQAEAFSPVQRDFLAQAGRLLSLGLHNRSLGLAEQSARQKAEARALRIDQLRQSAEGLNEISEENAVLAAGLQILMDISGATSGWVTRYDQESGAGILLTAAGVNATLAEMQAWCAANQPGCCVQTEWPTLPGKPRWFDCPLLAQAINGAGPDMRLLAVPLRAGTNFVGECHLVLPRNFVLDDDLTQVLAASAAQFSATLDRAFLFSQVHEMAIHDPLTGLYNRRYFFDRAEYEFDRSRRYQNPFSLLMLDLDFFKRVNDEYGHPAGDRVLQELSARLQAQMRKSDLLARYGGEEFIILLAETPAERARQAAERLLNIVRGEPFLLDEARLTLTTSIGVATLEADTPNISALIDAADHALYQAKHAGRNQIAVYAPATESRPEGA